jgi:diadenosine tetraphosphate (Ap4A) HIT family hydrolase
MLSEEQVIQIKQQLIEQINSTFPEDKKQLALEQIDSMDTEQLEEFLIQNNLVKEEDSSSSCVFCKIIEGKIPTNKIIENSEAIATLEINPISKAHAIVIPKVHSDEAPKKAFELAQEISNKINQVFHPKKIETYTSKMFDHEIINILPIYKDETQESKREKADSKELKEIQKRLSSISEKKQEIKQIEKSEEIISDKTHWLPRRIP